MNILLQSGIFGNLVLAAFGLLFIPGLIVVIVTRSRKVAVIFMVLSCMPIILGLVGTGIGYYKVNQIGSMHGPTMSDESRNEMQSKGRSEARSAALLGALATVMLLVTFGSGYALTGKGDQAAT